MTPSQCAAACRYHACSNAPRDLQPERHGDGDRHLAQVVDLMYVGDWASCYLALDHDVDPGPIDAIFQLKDALGSDV